MTIFNGAVAASADDARETANDSGFSSVATTIVARSNSDVSIRSHIGFRIPNVTIPAGSTINTCTATIYCNSGTQDDPNLDIFLEDIDDAPDYSTNADLVNRTRTTASVSWVTTGILTGTETTPDFASVLQEVIDRPGWASGQDINVIFWAKSDTDFRLQIRAYDNGTGDGPSITVDYTEGGGAAHPQNYYAQQ